MKYLDIITENKRLGSELADLETYSIAVLSNITVNQIKEVLEYFLRKNRINANVELGNYDNIPQDSIKFKKKNLIIIYWELTNLINGLQYKIELLDKQKIDELISKVKAEIDFVLSNLKSASHILINKFSSLVFNYANIDRNNLDYISDVLNDYLIKMKTVNVSIIDIDKIFARISIEKSVDFRYYYSSKALYSIEYFKAYSNFIMPIIFSLNGKSKKALILDCDNTLWKGIIGEDGIDAIVLSSNQEGGMIYEEVQSIVKSLSNEGVIMGLCSKNNIKEVNDVLNNHKGMVLKNDDFAIMKVDWNDKVSNLNSIAKTLNINIDSIVFIDDSDFEINYINESLPEIITLQVPYKNHLYPKLLREKRNLFYNVSKTREDSKRVKMYKDQVQRSEEKKGFSNLKEYVKSLNINIEFLINSTEIISRMSQMSLKTNQFNLTTKRYSEADIKRYINDNDSIVIAIGVSDKFGDNGITGLSIIKLIYNDQAFIDTFLLSCRVIGRGIENTFLDYIMNYLKNLGVIKVKSSFINSTKNVQVKNFYDEMGFNVIEETNQNKIYKINIKDYK
jgi:FkbH-like protein